MSPSPSVSDISAMLADRAEALCRELLPAGRREGSEWRVGDVQGSLGDSLAVHLSGNKAGVWADFATDDSGDLIDLIKANLGLGTKDAITWAKNWLGIANGTPPRATATNRKNGPTEPARPVDAAGPLPSQHPRLGEPSLWHEYTDAGGRLIFYHCRFDQGGGRKTYRPLSWQGNGRRDWPLWALLLPIGAASIRALANLFAKLGMESLASPFFVGLVGYTVSTVVALTLTGGARNPDMLRNPGCKWFMLTGAVYALSVLSLNTALSAGTLVVVTPIVACSPVFALLLGLAVFREEALNRRVILTVGLVVPSVVLITIAG